MNSISRKVEELGLNASAGHTMKSSGCIWYETKIRERKGQSRGVIQKGEPHERNPCAPKFEERTPEETSRQEGCARKAASCEKKKAPVLVSKNTEERMFVVVRELQCTC